MAHSLSSDTCFCNFYSASVADHALITDLFVFTAMTLPILAGSKNLLTEQTVFFRLQGSVINGFRFFYLPPGPFPDFLRRSQPNLDRIKSDWLVSVFLCCFWHF